MTVPVDQIIITAFITSIVILLTQGLSKKFFEKGSIRSVAECEKIRTDCQSQMTENRKESKAELKAVNNRITILILGQIKICQHLGIDCKDLEDALK